MWSGSRFGATAEVVGGSNPWYLQKPSGYEGHLLQREDERFQDRLSLALQTDHHHNEKPTKKMPKVVAKKGVARKEVEG